jgi:mRNA deadenylase 3'-5' endonuclease subunit Ccr4
MEYVRSWINCEKESSEQSETVRVVTYNILAPSCLRPELYDYAEKKILRSNYRKPKLLQELRFVKADIICLQVKFQKKRSFLITSGMRCCSVC